MAVAGLTFLSGLYMGSRAPQRPRHIPAESNGKVIGDEKTPPYLLQDVQFDLFWDVWNLVKENYIEQPVLDTALFYGALRGIVGALGDPYSAFLDPETTRKFTAELGGTFEGIGAEIGIKREQLVIVAPLPDTPAALAGLQPGDKILKINDNDTVGMPLDVAVANIRGPRGTSVTLKILRNGWKEPRDISIARNTIELQSVTWKLLEGGIGYIKIVYFNETTAARLDEAIRGVLAGSSKGLILDLRNNPGGFLEMGVRVAGQWLSPSSVVVIQEFQGGRQEDFRARGQPKLQGIPTVVLINQGSASAAEIVAGALQDYVVATLVGEKTFGKGSVQSLDQLRGGSALKLTIAHWLTPKGRVIDKVGITPDFEVKLEREDYENDRDPQLDKAIELVKNWKTSRSSP